MKRSDLTEKHCVPCEGGIDPFDKDTAHVYLQDLPGWELKDGAKKIEKTFKLKDFKAALELTNKIGDIAETEDHHPTIELSWGKVVVTLWTHAIDGLSENDFIVAAKIEEVA